jgi:hypothetical protein
MPCPVCSSESVFEAARRRRSEPAARLTNEVLSMVQEVRDISSRLRHRSGADPEAADMLDDLARRLAHACRETTRA